MPEEPKHPMQPLVWDGDVIRFKQNAIVNYLVDWCHDANCAPGVRRTAPDLNELSRMHFPEEDWQQLAQLIGYSVSGAGDLSYMEGSDIIDRADEQAERMVQERKAKSGG